jgi:hypothetical protein
MNREWHEQHKMPDGATSNQRIQWHLEHIRNCACRPFPAKLFEMLSDRQRGDIALQQAKKS